MHFFVMKAVYLFLYFNLAENAQNPAVLPSKSTTDDDERLLGNPDESCDSKWIFFNAAGLQDDLETKLLGQHIASRIILTSVGEFMRNKESKKPLVLSLQGTTGTGKTLATKLIAQNIYKKGMSSRFIHLYTPDYQLPLKSEIEKNKAQLQKQIRGNITHCERSMFIFDMIDWMYPDMLDTIIPFLGDRNKLEEVSYRKAIFIFISNAGGESFTQTALKFKKEGRPREEIELKDLEILPSVLAFSEHTSTLEYIFSVVKKLFDPVEMLWGNQDERSNSVSACFNATGSFQHPPVCGLGQSRLIAENLADFFVPFLPLEYEHVIQCVLAEMKTRGLQQDPNVADKVARQSAVILKSERELSAKGCKAITTKLLFYILSAADQR